MFIGSYSFMKFFTFGKFHLFCLAYSAIWGKIFDFLGNFMEKLGNRGKLGKYWAVHLGLFRSVLSGLSNPFYRMEIYLAILEISGLKVNTYSPLTVHWQPYFDFKYALICLKMVIRSCSLVQLLFQDSSNIKNIYHWILYHFLHLFTLFG